MTEKEDIIFRLLGAGVSKAEISQITGIPKRTVERCQENLRAYHGIPTNPQLYSAAATYLMVGELMATLETVLTYCPNLEVKREAQKRLTELETKYK